jgi:hypothetical protein
VSPRERRRFVLGMALVLVPGLVVLVLVTR